MTSEEIVIINDDNQGDSDIEEVDITEENITKPKSSNIDAITIEDDPLMDNDIIEIIDIDRKAIENNIKDYLNKVCLENRAIGEFIEECLNLENSSGMLRIIYRTFLPLYFKMEAWYRQSTMFKDYICMKLSALQVDPNKKFSILRTVCDSMKSYQTCRKKVPFTTLRKEVTDKASSKHKDRKRRKSIKSGDVHKKSKTTSRNTENVITVDDTDDLPETETRQHETFQNETNFSVQSVDEPKTNEIVILEDENDIPNSNKENNNKPDNLNTVNSTNELNKEAYTSNTDPPYLVPHKSVSFSNENSIQISMDPRIIEIEARIKFYKEQIDMLEQSEVLDDTNGSPYIQCEKYKADIVRLYKELCSITGSEAVKRREVRLTAADGQAQLPVKILEDYINENISNDGNPHFPDFYEVVDCVHEANRVGELGWPVTRIMAEARNLFTYCGQALQVNRKKRDWRYMLGRVSSQLEADPAESDPELMARLDANRAIGVKKELDLLDQYVKMEEHRQSDVIINNLHVSQDTSDEEFEDNSDSSRTHNNLQVPITSRTTENNLNSFNAFETVNQESSSLQTSNVAVFTHTTNNQNYIQQEKYVEKDSCNMLEINIENNYNPEVSLVTLPLNSKKNTSESQMQIAKTQENNLADTRMLEIYVEIDKPPEIKVVNISNVSGKESSVEQESRTDTLTSKVGTALSTTPENIIANILNNDKNNPECLDSENNEINTVTYEDLDENTDIDSMGGDEANVDSNESKNIVIDDVCSFAVKQKDNKIITSRTAELNVKDQNSEIDEDISSQIENNNTDVENTTTEESQNKRVKDETTDCNITTVSNDVGSEQCDVAKVVKPEFSDVLKDMEMFGDSFTATIFDIEDPFLVIEILDSSDESDVDS